MTLRYYVKATTTTYPGDKWEACAASFDTKKEAKKYVACEAIAWGDDGISYKIKAFDQSNGKAPYPYWYVDNCTYEQLMERVMK